MFLSAISDAGAAGTTTSNDTTGLADDFDTFLTLLTTQLQHQDPTDPLDTNEFTQQLVQFSEVEQAIKQTEQLEVIARVNAANAATNAVSFIGKAVSVSSATTTLDDGSANWSYESEANADTALFSIRDSSGQTVWTGERTVNSGRGSFTWDGRNDQGQTLPEGQYSLTIEARDAENASIDVDIEVGAIIDAVDFAGDEPLLLMGDQSIPLADVKSVTAG
jgi:flagellar basal-body rod modification protein FlgD